jgi:hypothetical protein
MSQHGLVLNDDHCKPDSLTTLGAVTITPDAISIEGFDSADASTCRQVAVQALTWAISVLQAELAASKMRPRGSSAVVD